jgi:hypothetical protein
MTAGYSKLLYPRQPAPPCPLTADNSYYLLNLSQAQVYFPAPPFARPAYLTLSSTIESPFQPGQPLKSLYQVVTFEKNQAFRLPISVNLSTFVPARANDTLRLTLRYMVTRDNPFQKLAGKMKEVNLVAKVSAVSLEWGAALKISEITGSLLSYLLQEGSEDTLFELYQDLNIADLKAGYWLIYGSRENLVEPGLVEIHESELRSDPYLDKYCYALLKVIAIPRLKEEAARQCFWWELLQAGKNKTLAGLQGSTRQKDAALREWENTLLQVMEFARKDPAFLLKEVQQIIQTAQREIDLVLKGGITKEAFGSESYPETCQKVLGVRDEAALAASLRDYHDAVEMTERLLKTLV